jgi:molybdopterin-guanine dinucleotide biosynthesis protein A
MSNRAAQRDLSQATLAVLAGGEGRRMGRPKGKLVLHGRPILHLLLDTFQWPGPTLLVTAPGREHPPGWERFTTEVVDPQAGQGPLRGILTALEHAASDLVVLAAVDMPGVRSEQIGWLVDALRQRPQLNGLLIDRRSHVEPFPSVFRAAALAAVRDRFVAGERSVRGLLREATFGSIVAPETWPADVWRNLNRPEDLKSEI